MNEGSDDASLQNSDGNDASLIDPGADGPTLASCQNEKDNCDDADVVDGKIHLPELSVPSPHSVEPTAAKQRM